MARKDKGWKNRPNHPDDSFRHSQSAKGIKNAPGIRGQKKHIGYQSVGLVNKKEQAYWLLLDGDIDAVDVLLEKCNEREREAVMEVVDEFEDELEELEEYKTPEGLRIRLERIHIPPTPTTFVSPKKVKTLREMREQARIQFVEPARIKAEIEKEKQPSQRQLERLKRIEFVEPAKIKAEAGLERKSTELEGAIQQQTDRVKEELTVDVKKELEEMKSSIRRDMKDREMTKDEIRKASARLEATVNRELEEKLHAYSDMLAPLFRRAEVPGREAQQAILKLTSDIERDMRRRVHVDAEVTTLVKSITREMRGEKRELTRMIDSIVDDITKQANLLRRQQARAGRVRKDSQAKFRRLLRRVDSLPKKHKELVEDALPPKIGELDKILANIPPIITPIKKKGRKRRQPLEN